MLVSRRALLPRPYRQMMDARPLKMAVVALDVGLRRTMEKDTGPAQYAAYVRWSGATSQGIGESDAG